jgi:hypothetical protein
MATTDSWLRLIISFLQQGVTASAGLTDGMKASASSECRGIGETLAPKEVV